MMPDNRKNKKILTISSIMHMNQHYWTECGTQKHLLQYLLNIT